MKTRFGVVCLFACVLASVGAAQDQTPARVAAVHSDGEPATLRSADGKTQATVADGKSKDSSGRTVETAKCDANTTTFRDRSGRTTQTASTDGNRTVFRDRSGRTTATATTNAGGSTTVRDRDGRTVYTATTNSDGKTTYKDRSGRTITVATAKRKP